MSCEPCHPPHTGLGERVTVPEWQAEAQDDVATWALTHWGVVSRLKDRAEPEQQGRSSATGRQVDSGSG